MHFEYSFERTPADRQDNPQWQTLMQGRVNQVNVKFAWKSSSHLLLLPFHNLPAIHPSVLI